MLEGFIDLVDRDDDGLVIVDYKTDTVPTAALDQRAAFYRPQLAAYAAALKAPTSERIAYCVLLFRPTTGAVERTVDVIDTTITIGRDVVRST